MKFIYYALLCFLFFSCREGKMRNIDSYELKNTNEIKKFRLDDDVRYNAFYLYTFSDKQGKSYLSFLNYRTNQLLFYDWNTQDFLFKVELPAEGPNGVTQISGYYIKNFDHIYVSTYAYKGLLRVDTTGQIVQKIPYGKTPDGYEVLPSYTPSSHPYIAPVFIGDAKMCITQPSVPRFRAANETPISVVIDTLKRTCEGLPMTYSLLNDEEMEAGNLQFSRIFNGKDFIYSFYVCEDVFVVSMDHSDIRRVKVKSRHIDSPTEQQKDTEQGPRLYLELPRYGDLIYDSYRKVYYRFAYPKVSLNKDMNWWGKAVYGRKKFSVMVLDEDFHVIGETLFPEGIYNSFVFFINKDGLYISRDYKIGMAEQSEDYLTFELFQLIKK